MTVALRRMTPEETKTLLDSDPTPNVAIKSYEDGSRQYILADDSRELTREEMSEYWRAHPGERERLIAQGIPFSPNYTE